MAKRRSSPRVSSTRPPPQPVHNALLAALPGPDYDRVAPALDIIPLTLKDVLHRAGEPIEQVYFPGGGFCSVLTVLEDGTMVEVATIGREGMLGVAAAFDGHPAPSLTMVQGETDLCYRMTTKALRQEMDRQGALYELLTHFSQALVGFIMQSTA